MQSLQLTGFFQYGVRLAADTENYFTSVERIQVTLSDNNLEIIATFRHLNQSCRVIWGRSRSFQSVSRLFRVISGSFRLVNALLGLFWVGQGCFEVFQGCFRTFLGRFQSFIGSFRPFSLQNTP